MSKAVFKLKVLTPLFMGGADPHGKPELRAASIRGAMRFWFRAIAGSITNDPREVYRLESEIFGNTEKKSKVVVKVKYHQPHKTSALLIKPEDPTKNKYVKPLPVSLAYLANMGLVKHYGKKELPRDIEKGRRGFYWARTGFSDNFKFEIHLISNSKEILDIAVKTLKIATFLGGFGTRWRHGFGSCEIIEMEKDNQKITAITIDIAQLIDKNLKCIKRLAEKLNIEQKLQNSLPMFPSFIPQYVQIWEGKILDSNSWEKALEYLGKKYREFRISDGDNYRHGHTIDFLDIIKPIFENNEPTSQDFKNDIFGLPIQFSKQYRTSRKTAIVNVENRSKNIGRRASPVIFHIEPNKRLVRATLFKSQFVPINDGTRYFIDKKPDLALKKPTESDYKRIEDFLEFLGLKRRYPNAN